MKEMGGMIKRTYRSSVNESCPWPAKKKGSPKRIPHPAKWMIPGNGFLLFVRLVMATKVGN